MGLEVELVDTRRDRDESRSLLEIRQLELAETQALAGTDSMEEHEVTKLFESLNQEILETAKAVKEDFRPEGRSLREIGVYATSSRQETTDPPSSSLAEMRAAVEMMVRKTGTTASRHPRATTPIIIG